MRQLHFRIALNETVDESQFPHLYAVDAMMVLYRAKATYQNSLLSVTLPSEHSCRIYFPWQTSNGLLMICTSFLRFTDQPYEYEVELARGTIGRMLSAFATWRDEGVCFSASLTAEIKQVKGLLVKAIFADEAPEKLATESINRALIAIVHMADEYARSGKAQNANTVGLILDDRMVSKLLNDETCSVAFLKAASHVQQFILEMPVEVTSSYGEEVQLINQRTGQILQKLESQASPGDQPISIGLGPMLNWHVAGIGSHDHSHEQFQNVREKLFDWSRCIAKNLSRDINCVFVASGLNARNQSPFDDHRRLQLTLDCMYGIHEEKQQMHQLASFMRPLGSEIDERTQVVASLHAADALLRVDVGLSQLGLEISFAHPERPSNRELIEINELLDLWSQFGLPLNIIFELPASCSTADRAELDQRRASIVCELRRLISLCQTKPLVKQIFFSNQKCAQQSNGDGMREVEFFTLVSQAISDSKLHPELIE
jgi:hypothetical protein